MDLPEFIESGALFRVPHDIILTDLRPDLLLISWNEKIIIIIELSCPNDEKLQFRRKEKRDKYSKLKRWVAHGWTCHIFSLEVSSRGFVLANSFFEFCGALGIEGPKKKSLRDTLSKTALRCSYVVWINRFNKKMYKRPITPCDIDHRFLFSKVKNVRAGIEAAPLTLDRYLDDDTEASTAVDAQAAMECKDTHVAVKDNTPPPKINVYNISNMKDALPSQGLLKNYQQLEVTPLTQPQIPSSLKIRPSRLSLPQTTVMKLAGLASAESKKRTSVSSTKALTQATKNQLKKYPKIYFPAATLRAKRYRISKGYHVGQVLVNCLLQNKEIRLQCFDHGQFPWGRSRSKGAMARICNSLDISRLTGARNTCLATHIFIGLLHMKIFSAEDLVRTYGSFMKSILASRHMRDDIPTIKAIFRKLKLDDKVCLRQVIYISPEGFVLLNDFYGEVSKPTIYLMHRTNHFFLGLA